MLDFDQIYLNIPCPRCEFPNEISMREMRFGLIIPCRGCKVNIRLSQKDGGLDQAKNMMDELQQLFAKPITIKL